MSGSPARHDESVFDSQRWFHSIDFGDFASSGRFKHGSPQNVTLYGLMDLLVGVDLSGATVLDIGTVDGLVAFAMRRLGAARVVATDVMARPTFALARDTLGVDVEYVSNVQVRDFTRIFDRGTFDVVVCSGVIYHMLNPASAFFECRKILREGGLLLLESAYVPNDDRAAIYVNSEEESVFETSTYSVPTKTAVAGLMRLACFDVAAVRTISAPHRITVAGRAVLPDAVRDRTALAKRIHEIDFCDNDFRISEWLPSPATTSLHFNLPDDDRAIDVSTFVPQFPYHPHPDKRVVGTTAWRTPEGNK